MQRGQCMHEGVVCTVIHESRELASPFNLLRATEYREGSSLCLVSVRMGMGMTQ